MYQFSILVSIAHYLSFSNAKLIIREANFPSREWRKSRLRLFFMSIGKLFYKRADFIICLAEDQKNDIKEYIKIPENKLLIIPNPVINNEIKTLAEKQINAKEKWVRPIFLAVGRLERQKRYDIMLMAFSKYIENGSDGSLIILGDGTLKNELEIMCKKFGIEKKVNFLGNDINPFKYMAFSDVYLMSSDHEGLPNSLIQACYITGRVISTDCPSGPNEILMNGKIGELVEVGDYTAMAEKMKNILKNEKVILPHEWREKYSYEFVSKKINNLIEKCVE
jgi:glycosyltransferase involved in cell wall biosynthesis